MSTNPNLTMKTDRLGATDKERLVPAGTEVTYVCHIVGGMVRVRFEDGSEEIMHPVCFPSLREGA